MPRTPIRPAVAAALIAVLGSGAAGAVNRRAFVTSTEYGADLAALPVAGATALDKADTVCRDRAAAGGLPNAATYRAWLSTSATDAYCHVQGLGGKKSNGCNGASQPGAGPWFQANGITAFSGSLADLTGSGQVIYRNILMDEYQHGLPVELRNVWTGTSLSGTFKEPNCSDWASTSISSNGWTGDPLATLDDWTEKTLLACNGTAPLLCVEPGAGAPFEPFWSPASLAFVTKAKGTGNLGAWPAAVASAATGLGAGDAICQAEARDAHLPGPETFVAWLSTSGMSGFDAVDRLTSNGPFKRVDGLTVANDKADLTDGTTSVSLHVAADGSYASPLRAWTGTGFDGTAAGDDCAGWTDKFDFSSVGKTPLSRVAEWTLDPNGPDACQNTYALYCFSNALVLFWDGFETTHDLSQWSAVEP